MSQERWFRERPLCNWAQIVDTFECHAQSSDQWVFRGQQSASDHLVTTLDRSLEAYHLEKKDALRFEDGLLRKFQREAHRFGLSNQPDRDDVLEWLAWMRHFGAPCRLLDCTYSFFIAVFFALERVSDGASIWAINADKSRRGLEAILEERGSEDARNQYKQDLTFQTRETFRRLFMADEPLPLVATVNPFALNERLVIQQGVFLCPGDISTKLEDLIEQQVLRSDVPIEDICLKYVIKAPPDRRREIIANLLRLNITRATLFPGLEGFAASLGQWLALPHILAPVSASDRVHTADSRERQHGQHE